MTMVPVQTSHAAQQSDHWTASKWRPVVVGSLRRHLAYGESPGPSLVPEPGSWFLVAPARYLTLNRIARPAVSVPMVVSTFRR